MTQRAWERVADPQLCNTFGLVTYLTPEEATLSMRTNKGIQARVWELWKRKVMAANP